MIKNSYVKHIALLTGASVLAQLINILTMPILTRMYSPSDFGVLSLFSSVVGMATIISGFRYYLVIPLARRSRYAYALVWLSLIAQVACVIVFAIMLEVFSYFNTRSSFMSLVRYRYLFLFAVLSTGVYTTLVQWAIREKGFSLIAKTKLTQVVSGCIIKFLGAFLNCKPAGLLWGTIAGMSFGSSALYKMLHSRASRMNFSRTYICRAAIAYRRMAFYDTPGALLNMAGAYLIPVILAYFFSNAVVGAYSMAQNLLVIPSAIVGSSVQQVFTQKAGAALYSGELSNVAEKTFKLLFSVGVFPVLVISMLAPKVFVFAFGNDWREAGIYASMLGPWIALNFVYSPFSALYTTLMLQKVGFYFVSVYTLTRILSVYLGRTSPQISILLLSISGTLMMLTGILILLYKAKVEQMIKICMRFMVILAIEILPIGIGLVYYYDSNWVLTILCIISCIIYLYTNYMAVMQKIT